MNKYDVGTGVVYSNKGELNVNNDYMRLAQLNNFDDYENLNYEEYQKWLTQKQNIITTNEELAKTIDANYDEGYNSGHNAASCSNKVLIGFAIAVGIPLVVRGILKIISCAQDIKDKKLKRKIQEASLASYENYKKSGK